MSEGPLTAIVYDKGRPTKTGVLPADSQAVDRIMAMLRSKQRTWQPSITSFVPGILVRGDHFAINFRPDIVILNTTNKAGLPATQRVSPLTEDEYQQIHQAVTEAMAAMP